eukprot:TRINITY_DN14205_c0_g1_i1.p1 TRINITY_DN14205_c0_g1~~TRINITY_DN14205_c0_g1_i1.p1  ORF type:complete len:691 (+),score=121.43 TRINITY_DN14205_c0_g1_i1:75-2147(+)
MGCGSSKSAIDNASSIVWHPIDHGPADASTPRPVPHSMWDGYARELKENNLGLLDPLPVPIVIKDREQNRPVWANRFFLETVQCPGLTEFLRKDFTKDNKYAKEYEQKLLTDFRAGLSDKAQTKLTLYIAPDNAQHFIVIYAPYPLLDGRMALLAVVLVDRAGLREKEAFRAMEAVQRSHNVLVCYDKLGKPLLYNARAAAFLQGSSNTPAVATIEKSKKARADSTVANNSVIPPAPHAAAAPPAGGATDSEPMLASDSFLPHVVDRALVQQVYEKLQKGEDVHIQADVVKGSSDEVHTHMLHATSITDPVTGQPMLLVTEDDVTEMARMSKLAEQLAERIAVMDLEAAENLCQELSAARKKGQEASALETALTTIVRNLKEYRPFLPESLFLHNKEDESEEEDAAASAQQPQQTPNVNKPDLPGRASGAPQRIMTNQRDGSPGRVPAGERVTPGEPRIRNNRPGSASSSASQSTSSRQRDRKEVNLAVGLTRRQVTLMEVTLVGSADLSTLAIPTVAGALCQFIDSVHQAVSATRGHVHSFNGGRILCSWNATQSTASHATRACRAALEIRASAKQWIAGPNAHLDATKWRIAVAISTGPLVVGNVGSARLKAFQTIGAAMLEVTAISRAQRDYRRQIPSLLVTQATHQLAQHGYSFRASSVEQSQQLWELVSEKGDRTNSDWMFAADA